MKRSAWVVSVLICFFAAHAYAQSDWNGSLTPEAVELSTKESIEIGPGEDADFNGIRDDVEAWISYKYSVSLSAGAAARQVALDYAGAAVAGPDEDLNGIRDDVDAWIEQNYRFLDRERALAKQAARAYRSILANPATTPVEAIQKAIDVSRAKACQELELKLSDDVVHAVLMLYGNTRERLLLLHNHVVLVEELPPGELQQDFFGQMRMDRKFCKGEWN